MNPILPTMPFHLEAVLSAERPRLVRLCRHLSGSADVAEDLAQETLLVAWRLADRLHDPSGYRAWLSAIARNVCRRWLRSQRSEAARLLEPQPGAEGYDLSELLPDQADLELDLERSELAQLLDTALGLLPPETRQIVLQKYLAESPHSEIAERLGLSEGAVTMRLQRGKLALRRILAEQLKDEAEAYGLVDEREAWQELRRWCPHCGTQRLAVRFDADSRILWLRCPGCASPAGPYFIKINNLAQRPARSLWPALARVMSDTVAHRQHLGHVALPCGACTGEARSGVSLAGQAAPQSDLPELNAVPPGTRFIWTVCPICNTRSWSYSTEMALYLPQGMQFWEEHRRIRTLPERTLEYGGRQALLTTLERVDGSASLDILQDLTNYEVLHVEHNKR